MTETVEQADHMELKAAEVKNRTKKGILILTGRTVFIQAISFFSNALLTVFLLPAQYGVFFLVTAIVNLLAYFGDIGFAASLIQKKEKLTNEDLRTVFTAQQVLVLTLVAFVLLAAPFISTFYTLEQDSLYLLFAVTLSLFFSSLKTIPSVLLERKLEFNKLIIPQIIETLVFNITAVYLAWQGFGVTSFTVAVLLRGFTGLIATYLISPWLPGISFSPDSFRSVLKFGIPYQANAFLAMIKDDGMTVFLGTVLGTQGIGLLGWAQKWAYAPLRFFMDQVIKVTFPAFSRLQDNRKELSHLVTKTIFFVCLLVFPSLVLLVFLSPSLISIIPKYSKWSPALFALAILAVTSALAAVTTPLTNILNAVGKISVTFKLMVMWTVLTWAFVPLASILWGLNGAAAGFTAVGLSSFIALYLVSKYVDIDYFQSTGKPLIASFVMGVILLIFKNLIPVSLTQVIAMILAGGISYWIMIFFLEPDIKSLIKNQFSKKR